MIGELFRLILFQPLFNVLIFFYSNIAFGDFGLAIIYLTILIKLVLYPFSLKAIRTQQALASLNPRMAELKERHKGNKEDLAKAMMALYKAEKVNPLSSIFLMLLQIPFLIAVYWAMQAGLNNTDFSALYPFVTKPERVNLSFLSVIDLGQKSIYLAFFAGITQYIQAKMLPVPKPSVQSKGSSDEAMASMMNKQMLYFMPVITVVIGSRLPSGLALYWAVSNILSSVQQYFLLRKYSRNDSPQ